MLLSKLDIILKRIILYDDYDSDIIKDDPDIIDSHYRI